MKKGKQREWESRKILQAVTFYAWVSILQTKNGESEEYIILKGWKCVVLKEQSITKLNWKSIDNIETTLRMQLWNQEGMKSLKHFLRSSNSKTSPRFDSCPSLKSDFLRWEDRSAPMWGWLCVLHGGSCLISSQVQNRHPLYSSH